jgi:hypothetical protein
MADQAVSIKSHTLVFDLNEQGLCICPKSYAGLSDIGIEQDVGQGFLDYAESGRFNLGGKRRSTPV